MPRATNKVASRARRKKVLKKAKGNWGRRKNVFTVAVNTVEKGYNHAYISRKVKKRDFRSLWIQRINAAVREHGLTYSVFINKLNAAEITLDRKALAEIAFSDAEGFKAIVDKVK